MTDSDNYLSAEWRGIFCPYCHMILPGEQSLFCPWADKDFCLYTEGIDFPMKKEEGTMIDFIKCAELRTKEDE